MATKQEVATAGFPGDPGYEDSEWAKLDFKAVVEDSGRKIDWEKESPFFGTYRGFEMKKGSNLVTGEIEEVPLLLFDSKDGERVCSFPNYALSQALNSEALTPGVKVKIEHMGMQDIGNGKSVGRMNISVAS